MSRAYHAFWQRRHNYSSFEYKQFGDINDPVLQKLLTEEKEDDGDVRNLIVIYGSILKFVPEQVITRWAAVDHYPGE